MRCGAVPSGRDGDETEVFVPVVPCAYNRVASMDRRHGSIVSSHPVGKRHVCDAWCGRTLFVGTVVPVHGGCSLPRICQRLYLAAVIAHSCAVVLFIHSLG